MSDLSSLFPATKSIDIGTAKVQIKTITLGDIPKVAKIANNIFEQKNAGLEVRDIALQIITTHFDSVVDLFVICTDLSPETVRKLNLHASMIIFSEIITENADFLANQVIPHLSAMAKSIPGLVQSKS